MKMVGSDETNVLVLVLVGIVTTVFIIMFFIHLLCKKCKKKDSEPKAAADESYVRANASLHQKIDSHWNKQFTMPRLHQSEERLNQESTKEFITFASASQLAKPLSSSEGKTSRLRPAEGQRSRENITDTDYPIRKSHSENIKLKFENLFSNAKDDSENEDYDNYFVDPDLENALKMYTLKKDSDHLPASRTPAENKPEQVLFETKRRTVCPYANISVFAKASEYANAKQIQVAPSDYREKAEQNKHVAYQPSVVKMPAFCMTNIKVCCESIDASTGVYCSMANLQYKNTYGCRKVKTDPRLRNLDGEQTESVVYVTANSKLIQKSCSKMAKSISNKPADDLVSEGDKESSFYRSEVGKCAVSERMNRYVDFQKVSKGPVLISPSTEKEMFKSEQLQINKSPAVAKTQLQKKLPIACPPTPPTDEYANSPVAKGIEIWKSRIK